MVVPQDERLRAEELLQAKSGRVAVRDYGFLAVSQKQVECIFCVVSKHS